MNAGVGCSTQSKEFAGACFEIGQMLDSCFHNAYAIDKEKVHYKV